MKNSYCGFGQILWQLRLSSLLGASLTGLTLLGTPSLVQAQVAPATDAPVKHTFVYRADKKLNSVNVAGTFNGWNKAANSMTVDADGLTWRLELPLTYGKHLYKFVLDGENWITDPTAKASEDDHNGNINSALFLLPPDYQNPASPTDGKTALSALLHQPNAPFLNYDRGQLDIELRTRPQDLRQISLLMGGKSYPMSLKSQGDVYAYYSVSLPWDKKSNLNYIFELQDGGRKQLFGPKGLSAQATAKATKRFQIVAKNFVPYTVPAWVEKTVFYQIFPDRFANGDKANDPPNVQAWDSAPSGFSRYGGDVAGVQQHLPYMEDLGVSSVYFNPVFKSPSNHRYDAEDYKQLAPDFGTNAEFEALTKDLGQHNIKTVMDFVFNHTATTFPAFMDIRQKGEASTYKDWYFIKSYPVKVQDPPNYVAWWNYPSMPKLNLLNPPTNDYMLDLVNFWKKEVPLMGMRLDVANEVDPHFWRNLRVRAKGLDPNMWIVGEVWGDGSPWLQGDQWDSVMNYQFRDACLHYFADGDTNSTQFTNRLMDVYKSYVPQVSRNMMNLLSSHDTPRFLTLCKNDAKLHQLAATVQFTWVGAPSIYYGEEIGMEGGADPDNRRGMRWDLATPDNEMLRYYKCLIAIRNSSPALQSGTPDVLFTDDANKTLAYARTFNNDLAIVVLNRSAETKTVNVPLPKSAAMGKARSKGLVDALTQKQFKIGTATDLKIQVAPMSALILQPSK